MKVELTTITPAMADEMLEKNINNRPLNERHVQHLAREIKCGRWKVNGDTICMNGSRLIDGQHRLSAIKLAGIPVDTLVVEGVSSDVFDTKDVGKRRSAGDTLAILGERNTNTLAAALVLFDKYVTGRMLCSVRYASTELEQILDRNPDIRESVAMACSNRTPLLTSSWMAALHYLFSRKDEDAATVFMERLRSGQGLKVGDPVYVLRERLVSNGISKAKLHSSHIGAFVVKAWNAERTGAEVRALRFGKDELFPHVR